MAIILGLFVRNSWNNKDDIAYNQAKYFQEYDSDEIISFRRYYFRQTYVNDVYLIPWHDLLQDNTAFSITIHYFNIEKFLNFYRQNVNKVGKVKAHYFCSSNIVPSVTLIDAAIEIHNDPSRYPKNFDNILDSEITGKYSSINYAIIPYYKFQDGTVSIQRLIDFYENADNMIDDFYCLYDQHKNQKRRPLWMSSDKALKMAWNRYYLYITIQKSEIKRLWHEWLGLLIGN